MQNNGPKTYYTIGAGWLNEGKKGEYIAVKTNGEKNNAKLLVQLEDGSTKPLDGFMVTFNTDKKSERSPDVSVWFSEES